MTSYRPPRKGDVHVTYDSRTYYLRRGADHPGSYITGWSPLRGYWIERRNGFFPEINCTWRFRTRRARDAFENCLSAVLRHMKENADEMNELLGQLEATHHGNNYFFHFPDASAAAACAAKGHELRKKLDAHAEAIRRDSGASFVVIYYHN
jgi:hypothetical protein